MKKHTAYWFLIWVLAIVVVSMVLFSTLQGQERDTVVIVRVSSCPCDSDFVRRTNSRIDRQTDVNAIIFTSLKDHAQAYYYQQHQIDSLRSLLKTWLLPTEIQLVRPKRRKK
jgi:hypothetical protein